MSLMVADAVLSCSPVKLVGTKHSFKGFLVEARNPTTPPPSTPHLIGRFTGLGHGTQTLNCDPAGVATEVYYIIAVLQHVLRHA